MSVKKVTYIITSIVLLERFWHKIFAKAQSYREIIKGSGQWGKYRGGNIFTIYTTESMILILNTTEKYIFFLLPDGSRGGDDDVDNELDYGWQEKEDPLQQELQNEKLNSQVKTEPDGGKLCCAMPCIS